MISKKVLIITVLLLNIYGFACSEDFKGKPQDIIIQEPRKALKLGETLDYSVEWLGIPVGKIVLKVEGTTTLNNYDCYHISATAIPNRFLHRLYDLEYRVDSYIEKDSFLPVRFEKIRRLNKETNFVTIDFDHKKNEAKYKAWGSTLFVKISPLRNKLETANPVTINFPEGTQDLFSSFYYFRIVNIKEGQGYPVNIYYGQRNWPVKMNVDKPFLREMRRKGTFAVVRVFPVSQINDYILGKRNLSVYLTVDSRRIPIEFKLNTAIGPFRGVIQDLPD